MKTSAHAVDGVVPFSAVDGSPLRGGFVERLARGGRRVFARERYVLDGSLPDEGVRSSQIEAMERKGRG